MTFSPSSVESSPSTTDVDTTLQQSLQRSFLAEAGVLETLQARALAQWQLHQQTQTIALVGPVARLRWVLRDKEVQFGLASLALVLVVAWMTGMGGVDPGLDELLEPDVLSLIAAGEL